MQKLYRNWTVHNIIAHPLSEVVWLISCGKLESFSNWIHDVTLPIHPKGQGRG